MFTYKTSINLNMTFTFQQGERSKVSNSERGRHKRRRGSRDKRFQLDNSERKSMRPCLEWKEKRISVSFPNWHSFVVNGFGHIYITVLKCWATHMSNSKPIYTTEKSCEIFCIMQIPSTHKHTVNWVTAVTTKRLNWITDLFSSLRKKQKATRKYTKNDLF